MPFAVHVGKVFVVAGDGGKLCPDRRRHEQRVAPPPDGLLRVIRLLHDRIELGPQRRDMLRFRMLRVQPEVRLPDGLIVGMRRPRPQRPVVVIGDVVDILGVSLIVKSIGGGKHAEVQCGEGPVLAELMFDARELPIGDLAHGRLHRRGCRLAGETVRQRPRVFRSVSNCRHLFAGRDLRRDERRRSDC